MLPGPPSSDSRRSPGTRPGSSAECSKRFANSANSSRRGRMRKPRSSRSRTLA